jgi:DNA-binding transcriptional ArsR family regulator
VSPNEIDRLVRERTRLAIMLAIGARGGAATFMELMGATPLKHRSRLTFHGQKLAAAGMIRTDKVGGGRTARTTFRLTAEGVAALDRLRRELDAAFRMEAAE